MIHLLIGRISSRIARALLGIVHPHLPMPMVHLLSTLEIRTFFNGMWKHIQSITDVDVSSFRSLIHGGQVGTRS